MRKYLYVLLLGMARMVQPKHRVAKTETLKSQVMAYQHPDLIERLVQKLEIPKEEAEKAFLGMKQYLYLAGTRGGGLSPQSEAVDEAWHNFMLFSLDYQKFCFTHFGRFIHHQPFNSTRRAEDNGQGSQNTRTGLKEEFDVVPKGAVLSGRCDPCSIACGSCNDLAPADPKVLLSDCINVPDGGCSGTTNCQNLALKPVHAGVACDPCCSGSQCCSDHS